MLHRIFKERMIGLSVVMFLGVIFFLGYFEQQISGFGASLFCLPFALLVIPREVFVPIALFYTWAQSGIIAWNWKSHIHKKQLLIVLFFASIVGIPMAGLVIAYFSEDVIKGALALFIVTNSAYCLYKVGRKAQSQSENPWYTLLMPVASGMMQTTYGVGGPLLVAYLSRTIHEKLQLRATICAYWLVLNSFILCKYFVDGFILSSTLKLGAYLFPAVCLGSFLGNKVATKISQQKFTFFIYCILILSAVFLII